MENNIANTGFNSGKIPLVILAVTALLCSRALFFFFNDAEGPNLLIVLVLAVVMYLLSLLVYRFIPMDGLKRLSAAVALQVLAVVLLYFLGR